MLSDSEGNKLVHLARLAVRRYLEKQLVLKTEKSGPMAGVFVTLNYVAGDEKHLRGCVGFPQPYKGLYLSLVEAAIAAATHDYRFPPIDIQELDNIIFEVSVLTELQAISTKKDIRIGKDGLLLKWKRGSGLLLPQVPVEFGWDVDEYLANLCYKAGAQFNTLPNSSSKLYRFQAQIFRENAPGG